MMILIANASVALELVGLWFTFRKMGLPGWKGIIPFYGTYVLFQKLWDVKQFWRMIIYTGIYAGTFLFGYLFSVFGGVFAVTGSDYRAMSISGVIFLILGILLMIASIVFLILMPMLQFQLYKKLAHAFGLKDSWAWGLLFLSFVFLPIIGFHKNIMYYGPVNQV
ncbi:MAG: hypothetical protein IJS27_02840 [Ruminococcus sp.]|nr:hypothetical protein [Ruminococcus sp.]